MKTPVGIAFIGTGFVADYYQLTLANHSGLDLKGVWDHNPARLEQFCRFYTARPYDSLDAVLGDAGVDIIVNLTTPENHFAINRAALLAGKHVYCEKPLGMSLDEILPLVNLAEKQNLILATAPANGLSDCFEKTHSLLNNQVIGQPHLVYVAMEDGPVFRDSWQGWKSRSGAPWPGQHEFEIGCTMEHAGYGLSWLLKLFGPVRHVQAFSALAFPNKGGGLEKGGQSGESGLSNPEQRHEQQQGLGADFSVGCLRFDDDVVVRITCGLAAPRDRSLLILGDEGQLQIADLWDNFSTIRLHHYNKVGVIEKLQRRLQSHWGKVLPFQWAQGRKIPYAQNKDIALPDFPSQIDFSRGIAHMAYAIGEAKAPFYSGMVAAHMSEITLALHQGFADYTPKTDFTPYCALNSER